jgi:AcrR family transcriptional regulator
MTDRRSGVKRDYGDTVATSSPPRRPRTQPPEVRREQILDAAAAVFTERGVAAAAMAEVAARAGVAKGTLYLYFDSKQLIVDALAQRYQQVVVDAAARLRADDGPLAERVERFLGAVFDHHRANLSLHHLLTREAGLREEGWLQAVEGEVAGALAADGIDRPDATARFLVYGVHGLLVAHLHRARPSRRAFLADAVPLVTRLLGTAPDRR